MKSREEQLWNHIDETASAEERAALEQELRTDDALQQELSLRKKLHEELAGIEPEQPSMRFTQNLMDILPKLYQRLQIKPLISKGWTRIYLAGFLLTVLALLGFGLGILSPSTSSILLGWTSEYFNVGIETELPFLLAIIVIGIATATLYLIWLDKRLRQRFK